MSTIKDIIALDRSQMDDLLVDDRISSIRVWRNRETDEVSIEYYDFKEHNWVLMDGTLKDPQLEEEDD